MKIIKLKKSHTTETAYKTFREQKFVFYKKSKLTEFKLGSTHMFKIILGTIPNIGLSNQGIFAIETFKTSLKTANDTNVIQQKYYL